MHQVLVFTKTKFGADKLARALTESGLPSVAMHGNKSQAQRTKALQKFKRGAARIMVATDVAARGLDIEKLPYVINFELPMVAEDYVHRIGRTGRAGEKGEAISFVCSTEHRLMRDIQHLLKVDVEFEVADGFEPKVPFPVKKPKGKPQPRKHGRSSGRNHSGPRAERANGSSSTRRDGLEPRGRSRSEHQGAGRPETRESPPARDGERSERREWTKERPKVSGERADSRQSRPKQEGERSERRDWNSGRPAGDTKQGKSRYTKAGSTSGKPSVSGSRQAKRDGFSTPRRKVEKRSVPAS